MSGIYSALSGMKMKELELESVAHNIANINTVGFKEEKLSFESVLSQEQDQEGVSSTPFVQVKEHTINFSNGAVMTTNNPMDMALQGDGFFQVQNEKGTFYTRNGTFALNTQGDLVTQDGDRVMGTNGVIHLDEGAKVEISTNGTIKANGEDIGQVKVIRFDDPQKLSSVGAMLFKAEDSAQTSEGTDTQVLQGKLESSNTNMMMGLVHLIDISRQYQMYQKVISNGAKLDQEGASSLGKIS